MIRGRTRPSLAGVVAVAVLVAGLGSVAAVPAGQVLVVEDATTGERLLATPVENGTAVTLAYTHSVERTPVRDRYVVQDGRLVMTSMEFESFGWGLPAGADVERVDGTYVYEPDAAFETLRIKPGRVAGHTLEVNGRTYDLVALSDARSIRVTVRDRSLVAVIAETTT